MSVETVARRYANALADIAVGSGNPAPVQKELKTWEQMLEVNHDLRQVFHNPSIPQDSKEKVLESLISKASPSATTANFLRVLLKNKRLTELGSINQRFDSVLDERGGVISAKVISARPLTDEEINDLRANLIKITSGKEIKLKFEIDESLIGGAITRVGSTVYDGSVKTQLKLLKEEMIKS
ncbi:MAG: ATP synthase F1 subunit delta [Pyrinomonadaceae bacterium]|nr:ATP synthase F1 subunit delta [Pyrinomonadaceae bacterium]